MNTTQQFWDRVEKTERCWDWLFGCNGEGYGEFCINGANVEAHRLAYELEVGVIPEGFHVLHHCDNRRCVRPDHLFLGTNADNMADMKSKGRGRGASGDSNGNAKLTPNQINEIRSSYIPFKYSCAKLAKKFGVSDTQIHKIISFQAWQVRG